MSTQRIALCVSLAFASTGGSEVGAAQEGRPVALIGATVIDGTGSAPLPDGVVLIENGRIRAIGPRRSTRIPDGFERRDLTGLTVLPGLIDSHVHLQFALPQGAGEAQTEAALDSLLREFLRYGITTIRDVGDAYPWITQLRRSIEEGRRTGPHVVAAGPLLTARGGHPAGTLLRGNRVAIEAATRQIDTPAEGRAVVRDLHAGGIDLIKVVFDSAGRKNTARPDRIPTLDPATLGAVIDEARTLHLPVTVHWGNVDELPAVLAARPTQLEHAGYAALPLSLVRDIADRGIAVDPTLTVLSSILPPEVFATGPLNNVRLLHAHGVVITAGTDAPLGNQRFGESLHRELELLVVAGLSPMDAIRAATFHPSRLLAREHDSGTLERGQRADLIAIVGNPLADVGAARHVHLVRLNGRAVDLR
jgi:enamidase